MYVMALVKDDCHQCMVPSCEQGPDKNAQNDWLIHFTQKAQINPRDGINSIPVLI